MAATGEDEALSFSEQDQKQLDKDKVILLSAWFPRFQTCVLKCTFAHEYLPMASCRLQRKIRLENEDYMRRHPEVSLITSVIISEVLKEAPANPISFVADYMTQPDLKAKILAAGSLDGIS